MSIISRMTDQDYITLLKMKRDAIKLGNINNYFDVAIFGRDGGNYLLKILGIYEHNVNKYMKRPEKHALFLGMLLHVLQNSYDNKSIHFYATKKRITITSGYGVSNLGALRSAFEVYTKLSGINTSKHYSYGSMSTFVTTLELGDKNQVAKVTLDVLDVMSNVSYVKLLFTDSRMHIGYRIRIKNMTRKLKKFLVNNYSNFVLGRDRVYAGPYLYYSRKDKTSSFTFQAPLIYTVTDYDGNNICEICPMISKCVVSNSRSGRCPLYREVETHAEFILKYVKWFYEDKNS